MWCRGTSCLLNHSKPFPADKAREPEICLFWDNLCLNQTGAHMDKYIHHRTRSQWVWCVDCDSELIGGVVNSRALWRWETAISFEWEQTVFQRSPSIYTNKVRGLTLWGFRLEGRVHRLHLWERICCADSLHQLTWWQIPWGSVHRFFFVVLAWIQLHSDDSELTTHNKEARNREEQLNSNVVAFLNLIKGKLCNNLQQFPCMSHFYMDHMWEDCNAMWKMRPYPSLSVDTSLRMIHWSCLMPQQ